MLQAVIFDFNGVLVDDEPIHFKVLQRVLKEEGISLTEKEYYGRYLGLDDRGCFKTAYQDRGRLLEERTLAELVRRKAVYYREWIAEGVRVFPGAKELVTSLSLRFPLAIGSGALKSEIETILESNSLRKYFQAIVSSEDIRQGKPDPEIFTKALTLLNQNRQDRAISASECLVVEDSREGIHGAHLAGMKCLAVANSRPPDELTEADAVLKSLDGVSISFLESLFQ